MKAVIMAGGKGSRISSLNMNRPKPMIEINGKPVLEHQIECLKRQGISDIWITVGYLSSYIIEYFGDGSGLSPATSQPFGVNIRYYKEVTPLGNAGALVHLKDQLNDDFLLINGDVLFDIDIQRFIGFHQNSNGLATLFTHPNDHPFDSSLLITSDNGEVNEWLGKEDSRTKYYQNLVNAGIHILSPKILKDIKTQGKLDLDSDILKPLAGTGQLFAYRSPEYVKDMGTPERFEEVCKDLSLGVVQARNLSKPQKAIFLDRDGTLNLFVGFLKEEDQLKLLPGVAEAIRTINRSGYLAIVITNQPVIARGEVTFEKLKRINQRLETLLGEEGAYIDALYYCPHHPDKGFEGEIKELKIICNCRKPKPGMIIEAAKDYNIDLSKSWMVGDSEVDVMAGKASGTHTALLSNKLVSFGQEVTNSNLLEFTKENIQFFEV
ncbi:D-glycero-D-manno-heptose 1,7-bisphosphate phosphatase [Clostridiaceae bacterium JG1575]|nr:D-glycero-D-manno-heptose 1,7-bisphosphate phosphatase [Clostridiaceae bacterium JG1575]